jgi:drug/metabolite transporter (DMT)-like permease
LTAILLGLAAAVVWGIAGVVGAHGARGVGAFTVLAWLSFVGVIVVAPFAFVAGVPDVSPSVWSWAALNGACTVAGLALLYRAFSLGKVGIIAPIVSTDGAMAAVFSIMVDGESIRRAASSGLAFVAIGVVLASARPDGGTAPAPRPRLAVALAIIASLIFALGFVATGRAAAVGPAWVVWAARLIGVVVVAVPVALRGGMRLPRPMVAPVVAVALLEPVGFACYVLATRDGVAIPAVLVTQSAVFTAIGGYLFLHERLTRLQLAGVVFSAVGVALLGLSQG